MSKSIDFEWYKVFYEVALRGSVSGAAADLAVSQPAVSQSIRNLEHAFGVRLFHRRSRGVELTETGRKLYSYVRESYRLLKQGERTVLELLELSAETLLIGAPYDLGTYLLTPLLKEFRRLYPDIKLKTQAAVSSEIVRDVASGRLDAGFVSLPADTGSLKVLPLMEIGDVFVAGGRPELKGRSLSSTELLQLPLALPPRGSTARSNLELYLKPPSDWSPEFETTSCEGILRFAAAGLGVGFVPEAALEGVPAEELSRLKTAAAPPLRRGGFICRREVPSSSAVRLLQELLSRSFKNS